MFDTLKNKNPELNILSTDDKSFKKYGKRIDSIDFTKMIEHSNELFDIPDNGTVYVASSPELEDSKDYDIIRNELYGGSDIQVGWCIGHNQKLNAFEYHKGCELIVAVTDIVLILADLRDVENNEFKTDNSEVFYVKKGGAVELYNTTMHFAPISVSKDGFAALIILPRGTNEALKCGLTLKACKENDLLWMKNKWMICHPDSPQALKGAFVGLVGPNITLKI